ncbi:MULTISPECIES: patatin-like phospholipase family protein [Streptomyces]|uniref:patatin-like phospholipase family protein n=1 Tax=Streptomyces TaxID=1883 RepID=UPI00140C7292|nr:MULTISPECIES: patatin-like phospholipase family protein [Streptomyces]MDH6223305.1 putative patatin/cPLA2 family phospholipase [Streptomyces sp. MJP52]
MSREHLAADDRSRGPRPDSSRDRHKVLEAVAGRARAGSRPGARDDGMRLALVIEGGGMRGTLSAGMALALHEAGVVDAFDAVYGSSAGAITGAWLLSGTPEQLNGWAEPEYANAMIRLSNFWRGRPVVDVRTLVEHLYAEVARMDFDAVLSHPVEYHPLATDAHTGLSTDLRPYLGGPADLRLALRASAALPFLAGPAVELGGRHFYDAGLAESVPYRTALAQGATHVLVLRSRPAPQDVLPVPAAEAVVRPSYGSRLVAATALRRYPKALHDSYFARAHRQREDEALLSEYDRGGPPGRDGAAVMSIRPALDAPRVGRLTRDGKLLRAALEAGRAAVGRTLRLPSA